MRRFKNFCQGLVVLIVAAMLLVACGDSSTVSPASSGGATSSIKINGTSEVTLDPALNTFVKNAFASSLTKEAGSVPDLALKMYSSDSDLAKLVQDTDATIAGAGYKYIDPNNQGATKMSSTGNSATGFYTKADAPDLIPAISDATSFTKVPANLPAGVDAAAFQKFADQFKGKKSALILISGTGILDSAKKAKPTTDTSTAVVTTVAPTTSVPTKAPTTAAPTTATVVTTSAPAKATASSQALILPDIDNADEIKLSQAIESSIVNSFKTSATGVNDLVFKVYGSDDETQDLTDNTQAALTGSGYKFTVPGQTKPFKQGSALVGFYGKANAPDLFIIVGDPAKGLGVAGLDSKTLLVIAPELKDKSSVLIVIAGTGLTQAFTNDSSGGTATTAAPAQTTAVAASNGSKVGQELVGIVYDNNFGKKETITKVELSNGIKDANGTILKPKGVWLIVYCDIENKTDHITVSFFDLVDNAGNVYSSSSYPLLALGDDPKYNDARTPDGVPGGGKGKGLQVFDVPVSVTGLKPQ